MSLHPCPHCQRHVRVSEVTCPFCAGELPPLSPPAPRIARGLTRAALFAGAGLLASCSSKDSVDKKTPPPATQRDASIAAAPADAAPVPADATPRPADAAPRDAAPAADAAAKKKRKRKKKKVEAIKIDDRLRHNKPYGAPPNRVRRA